MSEFALTSCYFTTSTGRSYTIIRTEYGRAKAVKYALDTVKNQEGKLKTMERLETLKLINS